MFLEILFAISLFLTRAHGAPQNDSNFSGEVEYLENNSIIYALSFLAQEVNVSQQCRDHLSIFQEQAVKKSAWAMKMLDASGQRMSGFLFGQVYWLGDRQICKAVQETVNLLISPRHNRHMHWSILNETAPFDVSFSVAYLRHTSPWNVEVKLLPKGNIIQLGLCTPSACAVEDLKALIDRLLLSDFFPANHFYELNATVFDIKKTTGSWLSTSNFFQSPIFICIAILCCLILLLIVAAAVLSRKSSKQKAGHFVAFIQCFNVAKNSKKIFNMDAGADTNDVPIINGIRVTVSILIVFIHATFFSVPVLANEAMYLTSVRNNSMLFAHTIVDFFLFISGFLQAYKFLNSERQMESIKKAKMCQVSMEFFKRLFHRWLRLAVLFYLILCLDAHFLMGIAKNSIFRIIVEDDINFRLDWWRYLLFIHNYIDSTRIIAAWTWSLACEMHFFMGGTLLMLLYAKKPRLAKIVLLAALVVNFVFYYKNGIKCDYNFFLDAFVPIANSMYINSLIRCTPYVFGILCGWYLSNQKRRLNALAERVIGNSAFIVFIILMFLYNNYHNISGAVSTSVLIVARVSVCLWLGWLITAAISKRTTWISPFFELSIFRPLARLSYSFYLLHPLVILSVSHMSDTGVHLDSRLSIIMFFGYVVVSFFGATLLSLAFELPFCNLSSLILKRNL